MKNERCFRFFAASVQFSACVFLPKVRWAEYTLTERYSGDDIARVKRPYLIAKECGCKFYMATDAHHNEELKNAKTDFERRVDFLELKEEQKFKPFG